ncbi:hypothetical protein AB0I28_16075 [Phytomonospora sp. NPDC050363]|uniref:hypothetical protein n=1 Tax=Phytomonospora sp. NPDC050363 TaxID=3155642 RepID=UPI0033D3C372
MPPHDPTPPSTARKVFRVLAVCVGVTLGAMIGSLAGDDGEGELPSDAEVAAIAVELWPERALGPIAPGGPGYSQEPHEDIYPQVPGWLQVLAGDATQDAGIQLDWPAPEGYTEPPEGGPYVDPESPADNERRLAEAERRLSAGGWDVHRPYDEMIEARRDGVLVQFFASGGDTPFMSVWRVASDWHGWCVLVGVLLGGAAGYFGSRLVQRRNTGRDAHPSDFLMGLGLVLAVPSFLMIGSGLVLLLFALPHLDVPLWRHGRMWLLGAFSNVALLSLVAGVVWHVLRRAGSGSRPGRS